jgi:acyl-coenzyme A thioesterase PaaI-like protein
MDLSRINKYLSSDFTQKDSIISKFADALELVNWNETTKTILFKMTITRQFCNLGNFMNGGAIATLIDFATSSVVFAVDQTRLSLSIDMDVNYVAMGKEDELIFVEAT